MLGKQGNLVNLSAALPEFSTPFIRRHTSAILCRTLSGSLASWLRMRENWDRYLL